MRKSNAAKNLLLVLLVLALVSCTTRLAFAEPVQREREQQTDSLPDALRDLPWRFFRRANWASVHARGHANVKSAFRTVTKEPTKSTVEVLSGGKRVALGAVVDKDGYVLTKASELDEQPQCRLSDGRLLDAQIIGLQLTFDLAMLQIDADDLTPVSWSEEGAPEVGSLVATPGHADLPLAIGVISVAPRPITHPPAMLGVELQQHGLGPQIAGLRKGSGAERAGLQLNDVITHVNGAQMETSADLVQTVRRFRPGDKLQLVVRRGGQDLAVTATLSARSSGGGGDRNQVLESLGGPLSQRRAGFPLALQHDTILSPDICGGPLIDLEGRAIGLNIARADRVSSYALPASTVTALLDDLKSGRLAPPSLLAGVPASIGRPAQAPTSVSRPADLHAAPMSKNMSENVEDGAQGGRQDTVNRLPASGR